MQHDKKKKQQRKNVLLAVLVLLTFSVILILLNYNPYQSNTNTLNKSLFKIENAEERLTKLVFSSENQEIALQQKDSGWIVNEKFRLDPAMQQVLFSVFEQMEVKREIPDSRVDPYRQQLQDTGISVTISGVNGKIRTFTAGGSLKEAVSYFLEDDKVYQIYLPGYQNYVSGIFEVGVLDWRERTVFNATWQDVEQISLQYPDGDSLSIAFQNGSLMVENMEDVQQQQLMQYVEQFNYFYVDQFLADDFVAVEQIDSFEPAGSLRIKTLNPKYNLTIQFYRNPNFNAILSYVNGRQYAGIRKERYNNIFVERDYFKAEPASN